MNVQEFFSKEEQQRIVEAIQAAENKTSGEIRLHLDNHCKGEILDRCASLFLSMNMQKTDLRNGVLIYLAVEDHKFSIIGDVGINQTVSSDFWEDITSKSISLFKEGKYIDGVISAITMSGDKLKESFPVAEDDVNELSDDISFGN